MAFKVYDQFPLAGVVAIVPDVWRDSRGDFAEIYREDEFTKLGIGPFVQENYSHSKQGVLRGLHYQTKPKEVGKLVSCIHGRVFDVVLDIRHTSKTFGHAMHMYLSEGQMLWVPPGCAHGFYTLTDTAAVLYRQTQYYSREHDRAIRWDSADVKWPLVGEPILSDKDAKAPVLDDVDDDSLL